MERVINIRRLEYKWFY